MARIPMKGDERVDLAALADEMDEHIERMLGEAESLLATAQAEGDPKTIAGAKASLRELQRLAQAHGIALSKSKKAAR